jgi:hypothetical protein
MSNKNKDKVPKSDKTRLSDLAPQKQARGGGVAPTPPGLIPPVKKVAASPVAKGVTLPPF